MKHWMRALGNWYVYLIVAVVMVEEFVAWLREHPTTLLVLTAFGFSLTVIAIAYASEITFP